MQKKKSSIYSTFVVILALAFAACASTPMPEPSPVSAPVPDPVPVVSPDPSALDELVRAIGGVSAHLNSTIPRGRTTAFINVQSGSEELSNFIIDNLIANAVNDRSFPVVDRHELDRIREELGFQLSAEVDDETARSIGQFSGAHTIVSGRVTSFGGHFHLTIRALDVQTAHVQSQSIENIGTQTAINALIGNGRGQTAQPAQPVRQAPMQPTPPAPPQPVTQAPALPTGITALTVNNIGTWNTAINRVRNGGNGQTHVINVTRNISVPTFPENLFGPLTGITVYIVGSGTISTSVNGSLLRIGAGQTVVLRDVTLRGRAGNDSSVVVINSGGIFRMEGSASVRGNTRTIHGGVLVDGGTFIMQDSASVTGNSRS